MLGFLILSGAAVYLACRKETEEAVGQLLAPALSMLRFLESCMSGNGTKEEQLCRAAKSGNAQLLTVRIPHLYALCQPVNARMCFFAQSSLHRCAPLCTDHDSSSVSFKDALVLGCDALADASVQIVIMQSPRHALQSLLRANPAPGLEWSDPRDGMTALCHAASEGYFAIAQQVLPSPLHSPLGSASNMHSDS